MRFFSTLLAIATAGLTLTATSVSAGPAQAGDSSLSKRQEALRFGTVNVSPSNVTVNQPITITYNSTLARFTPQNVDIYLQGQLSDRATPFLLLSRNEYADGQKTLVLDTTVPDVTSFLNGVPAAHDWLIWAFITYPNDGLVEIGGTSAPIAISTSD